LIFPQKLIRSNGSPNFRVSYSGHWKGHRNVKLKDPTPLGVAGVAASTADSLAELEITLTGPGWLDYPYPQYAFHRVKVFHNIESKDYEIEPVGLRQPCERLVHEAAGYTEFRFSESLTELRLQFRRISGQGPFLLRGLLLENDAPGFSYSAIGVNGATLRAYLHCEHLAAELSILSPDLVISSIGVNDTRSRGFNAQQFEAEYEALLQRIKSAAPHAALLLITNSDNLRRSKQANANTLAARQAILRLAQRYRAAVWDLFEVMGGLKSFTQWQRAHLAKRDRVHFNHDGYTLLGELFFEAFVRAYQTYHHRFAPTH
ncbi:MAG: GDSL-type esterase/lipase family protein, partial [Chloroherpetonaceae bacterium]|nr:GDSL-type esterase/lipase family protein [Chloroherpetonaceae bacterium]